MNILITGASGFVGKNLVLYLKHHHIKTVNRTELNSFDSLMLKGIDAVIHLAGKAHDLKKTTEPEEYEQINFGLTKKLYDAFLESDAKKFIFISSVKAAADSVEGVLTEDILPNPQTPYGKSKLMAEQYIQSRTLSADKFYYILRPCMIHGKGNKGNLNLLYQFVKLGIPYPLAAFANQRSFLSVENLCFVINELLKKIVVSGLFQVADDEALATSEVVATLAQVNGKKPLLWKIPKSMLIGAAKLGSILRLPLNEERLQKLTDNYVVSNQKIIDAIGVQLPIQARAGLITTAKSFKEKER